MDILKYKEFEGTAELDMEQQVCRGKILFISDLVTYKAASPADLKSAFEAAVDDYLDTCKELGREPQKPLKGQFNVRISPAMHKQATMRAFMDNLSLNEVVVHALDAYLNAGEVNHHVETKNYFVTYGAQHLISASTEIEQMLWSASASALIAKGGVLHVETAH